MDWVEAHYGAPDYPAMYPSSKKDELLAKQVQVVADGICDAGVLLFFEKQREYPSKEWEARQSRKVEGGLRQLSEWVGEKEFIIGGRFGLADIAAGSALGWFNVRWPDQGWQGKYPNLKRYIDDLERRESFKGSVPYAQKISDKIV
jgi:glutathione S-transferase